VKALVLQEYNQFELRDMPQPEIRADEVLVKVKACGICGSDVHGMDGSTGRRQPPIVMGHEAAGVIAEVGSNVTGWQVGDRVTFDSTVYCGECHFCRRGKVNLCDNRRVLGVACDDYRMDGAFAEYVAIPQRILYRLPDAITFEHAAMVEPVSVALHAVWRTPIRLNDTAVVMGVGMIGLLVLQVLRASGCGTVVAVDIDQGKLDLARELGADLALNPNECDVPEAISQKTEGRGAQVAFEVVGVTPTIVSAVKSIGKGGTVTLIGNVSPEVAIPLQDVVARQISLRGSYASAGEYPTCLEMIAGGAVEVNPLISAVAPLSEGQSWFDRLYRKEPGLMKVILAPEGEE
jgi:L-iditol 2-dehydrogenase